MMLNGVFPKNENPDNVKMADKRYPLNRALINHANPQPINVVIPTLKNADPKFERAIKSVINMPGDVMIPHSPLSTCAGLSTRNAVMKNKIPIDTINNVILRRFISSIDFIYSPCYYYARPLIKMLKVYRCFNKYI